MRAIQSLILVLCFLFLTSCATVKVDQPTEPLPTPAKEGPGWDKRVQTLSSLQSWNVKGTVAVKQKQNAWSASLQWRQQGSNYHILLFGPMGTNSHELTGKPGQVRLSTANGKVISAQSPEDLVLRQAGFELPVSNLHYWIRGIPAPNYPAEKQLDSSQRLITLKQQGWYIRYLSYTSVNNIDLPSKIFLSNPQLNVKILINQWN